jgi:hypothetical protein
MVVGNETRLVTATYLARTDSDDMPCFELGRGGDAALAIYDDLHKLADLGAPASTPAIAPGAAAALRRDLRVGAGTLPAVGGLHRRGALAESPAPIGPCDIHALARRRQDDQGLRGEDVKRGVGVADLSVDQRVVDRDL